MCGRFTNRLSWRELVELYRITEEGPGGNTWRPRFNLAPTQDAPIVRSTALGRQLALLRWNLVPPWSKDPNPKYSMINARAETVREKRSFRGPFEQRRCLVPATGFYEWTKAADGGKQPYLIAPKFWGPFALAGLWERWPGNAEHEPIESFTIVVTAASAAMGEIHDRMPVIVAEEDYEIWLSGEADRAAELMRPWEGPLEIRPVSRRVNSPRNDDESLVEAVGEA